MIKEWYDFEERIDMTIYLILSVSWVVIFNLLTHDMNHPDAILIRLTGMTIGIMVIFIACRIPLIGWIRKV